MGSEKHQVAGQGLLMSLMPGLLLFHAGWTASKSRPQPKVAMVLIIRDMERRAGEHYKSMIRLSLPVQALADEVSKVLGVGCVHHVEVVTAHHSELHVVFADQLVPAVAAEVGAVVKKPLHRSLGYKSVK
jgi:hypothetical protein